MGEQQNRCPPTQSGRDSAFSHVLGDFSIENRRYLVICLDNHFPNFTEHDFKFPLPSFTETVVGQLKMQGKDCVIVEVEGDHSQNSNEDIISFLTERELQIVQLIAQGHSNKQIAQRLRISEWTVSTHLRRVFAKLGVDSRAAMVYRCSALLNNLHHLIE